MKAVVVHGPKGLSVEEVPETPVGHGEVAVDTAYGGICGYDLHYWRHGRNGSYEVKEPLVMGHKVVGRVRELGGECHRLERRGCRGDSPGNAVPGTQD